jgi:hypothetical protein
MEEVDPVLQLGGPRVSKNQTETYALESESPLKNKNNDDVFEEELFESEEPSQVEETKNEEFK